jgi:hypothetical protein
MMGRSYRWQRQQQIVDTLRNHLEVHSLWISWVSLISCLSNAHAIAQKTPKIEYGKEKIYSEISHGLVF